MDQSHGGLLHGSDIGGLLLRSQSFVGHQTLRVLVLPVPHDLLQADHGDVDQSHGGLLHGSDVEGLVFSSQSSSLFVGQVTVRVRVPVPHDLLQFVHDVVFHFNFTGVGLDAGITTGTGLGLDTGFGTGIGLDTGTDRGHGLIIHFFSHSGSFSLQGNIVHSTRRVCRPSPHFLLHSDHGDTLHSFLTTSLTTLPRCCVVRIQGTLVLDLLHLARNSCSVSFVVFLEGTKKTSSKSAEVVQIGSPITSTGIFSFVVGSLKNCFIIVLSQLMVCC